MFTSCVQASLVQEMKEAAASLGEPAKGPEPGYVSATLLVAGTEYTLEYPVGARCVSVCRCVVCSVLCVSSCVVVVLVGCGVCM